MDPLSRRAFLAGVCGVATATIAPLSAEAASSVKKLSDGRLSLRVRDFAELKEVGSSMRIGSLKGKPVAITRTGPSAFIAFTLVCPHQGVTVVKDETGWVCKAHGSKFESDGALNFGPATTDLPRVRARLSKGVLTVG